MGRVFSDPSVCAYEAPGHPEAPFRVRKSAERLAAAGHRVEPPPRAASPEDARLVHTSAHWDALRTGFFRDPDTPAFPKIHELALVSAAGALSAMESALAGEPAFSLMRPPGHHAGKERIAGFCYLNNLALACRRAIEDKRAVKVAILDVDVHHGDGTEDIVLGDRRFVFCSLHQVPLYPGTGTASRENCFNVPLDPGTDGDRYLRRLEPALQTLVDSGPDLLAVSAGFDTYKEDPLAQLAIDRRDYRRIGRLISGTGLRRFAVLEGGYADALPLLIEEFLDGFF